jgi:tetratricopeptide (TPR) repeat protein
VDPAFAALVLNSVRQAFGAASDEAGRAAWQGLVALVRRARREPDAAAQSADPGEVARALAEAAGRDPGFAADLRRWMDGHAAVLSQHADAAREVVQARDIAGGVHFHTPAPLALPAPVVPRQLPGDVPGFVGRAEEFARLEALLAGPGGPGLRLAVVAGTAGAGKTSLAVRFAHRVRDRFPDGQLFVNLRGYDTGPPLGPGAALERFLRALGTEPSAIPRDLEERAEVYRSLLADRRILVVLDNAATVGQVRPLLPGEPGCLVLVTSRSRLSGLSAREGARRLSLGLLTAHEAVELIESVTEGYRSGDAPEQVAELARLCARLPLALRIAAERAAARPLMPLSQLIGDLRSQSSLWDALSSDEEVEADAVRTVFAWSYRALPPTAARAFRLLGLHPGPDFGVGAAAALLAGAPETTRTLLDALAGAHLLEQTGPARYQLHDLLRAYAADLAVGEVEESERAAALARLTHWYLYTADAANLAVQTLWPSVLAGAPDPAVEPMRFPARPEAAAWYGAERANLLALAHTLAGAGLDQDLWRLAATLCMLQDTHGAVDDWLETGRLGLEAARHLGDRGAEARMLQNLGYARKAAGQIEASADLLREALDAYTALGDAPGRVEAGNAVGLVHLRRRELDQAAALFSHAADLAAASRLHQWHPFVLENLARTRLGQGRLAEAATLAAQVMAAYDQAGYQGTQRLETFITLTGALRESGDLQQAEEQLRAADRLIAAGQRHLAIEVALLLEHAHLAMERGRNDAALELFWQCEQLQRPLPDRGYEAAALTGTGQALTALGRVGEAADLHRRAVVLRRSLPDFYRLAEAQSHLADALDDRAEAAALRGEALGLLAGFTDPRALALRERITAHPAPSS